ncbi:MAG TPA: multicopper oxidase domain-containing protein [Nitrososphaeraceae archaeon]|nr:multicopper oxidase domain-containing protein [Nitrososphaeraceae archaeon]
MKMNNLLKNSLMGIFAVMLLTSTLTMGVQNGINTEKIKDSVENNGSVHPIIQMAEASKEIDNKIQSEKSLKNLKSNPFESNSEIGNNPKETLSQNGTVNEVTIKAEKLPNGQYAYRMLKHIIYNGQSVEDLTERYPKIPTIPGPSIEMTQHDSLILHSIDETGIKKTQKITAQNAGTFEYYGEHYRTLGLFGAIIINPIEKVPAQINGKVVSVDISSLEKQYVLFMVGSTFWGQEIDSNHNQKPLWTNPTLGADLNQLVRFHILGAAHQHTFHLHAHRWLDPGTTNIIDTKLIDPQSTHWFIVEAGDKVGIGTWQYHCHVFAHMEAGMMGEFKVGSAGSNTQSVPGVSPLIGGILSSDSSDRNDQSIIEASLSEKGSSSQGNFITFDITDEPGQWFRNVGGELLPGTTKSLGVVESNGTAHFIMSSTNTVHTISSLLWPTGAPNMPFDQMTSYRGGGIVQLEKPGLYLFTCKIHPYMFGAIIVDDPNTEGLDLGDKLSLSTGTTLDPSKDNGKATIGALLRTFFIANNPNNWQDYSGEHPSWNLQIPEIDVNFGEEKTNLKTFLLNSIGDEDTIPLNPIRSPSKPGIGEVWIDTQFEKTAHKSKPGTATKVNVENWQVERKVSLPQINMNNPHNMWSDSQQDIIYQTQWFDNRLTAFDRHSGKLLDDIGVGDAPSHVITNPINDLIYVALSGEQGVAEIKFNKENSKFEVLRIIPMQESGQDPTLPQGPWITPDGRKMITPNHSTDDITITDFTTNFSGGEIQNRTYTGHMPIATGMMPDGKTAYVANFLSSTLDVIDMDSGRVLDKIDLADKGNVLPIQTPVSPNGQYVVTANALTGSIAITDTDTNTIVKTLPCDPGCHGVNFGAKEGGGYYAYVSSKFSNRMIVVDGDPNNDGDASDAKIAGTVLLTGGYASDGKPMFNTDDEIIKYDGMGGQGVYPIPNINPGWVEMLDLTWNLTQDQRDPLTSFNQLQNPPIQASSNDDSTNNKVNSQSMQHQQDQIKPPTIEEKISEVQQQTNGPVINSNSPGQPVHPTLDNLNNIISQLPVPTP